jgi:hypothetical protein
MAAKSAINENINERKKKMAKISENEENRKA